jgi:hypothetical protein
MRYTRSWIIAESQNLNNLGRIAKHLTVVSVILPPTLVGVVYSQI